MATRLTASYRNEIVTAMVELDNNTHDRRFKSIKGMYLHGIISQLESFTALYELVKGAMKGDTYLTVSQFEKCMREYFNLK